MDVVDEMSWIDMKNPPVMSHSFDKVGYWSRNADYLQGSPI